MTAVAPAPGVKRQVVRTPGIGAAISIAPWPVLLFLFALLVPTELGFFVGDLRLSWFRIVLLVAFIPCMVKVYFGGLGRSVVSDWLMAFHVVWAFLCVMAINGLEPAIKSQGIYAVEAMGAYMLGRCYVRDERTFRAVATILIWMVIGLMLLTIPESITGRHLIHEFASHDFKNEISDRFGLSRAYGPFEHPILYGVFSASVIGFAWYLTAGAFRAAARCFAIVIASLASVSSGPTSAIVIQVFMIAWHHFLRNMRGRWWLLGVLGAAAYALVDMASNRRPMEVALAYLTFNAETAYGRMQIWDYGSAEVWRHPILGIGLNDWERPTWFASGSMDNFWLVLGVCYGLPGVFSFMGCLAAVWAGVGRGLRRLNMTADCGRAWIVTVGGLSISACTVHLWNALFVYFCFLIGAGVWMAAGRVGSAAPVMAVPPRATKQSSEPVLIIPGLGAQEAGVRAT